MAASARPAAAQYTAPLLEKDLLSAAPGIVINVQFDGNDSLSDAELQTVVSTKVPSWFSRTIYHIPFIGSALGSTWDTIDYVKLQHDTAMLNQYYKDHGFLMAKSSFEVRAKKEDIQAYQDWLRRRAAYRIPPTDDKGPLLHDTVIFHIFEGPPYIIRRVTFTGLEALPEEFQPELTEHVTLKSDTRWNIEAEGAEAARIDSIMRENGFPFFNRDSTVVINNLGTTTVNVEYFYTTGPRLKFGPTHIVYDTNAAERRGVSYKVIHKELLTDSGQWYKQSLVQRSEANLQHLNAFEMVVVSLDTSVLGVPPDSIPDGTAVPVRVFLRPRLRAEITPGIYAGMGSQGGVFGVTGNYTNRNLTGKADNVSGTIGWQFLPGTQERRSANVDYVLPAVIGRAPISMGAGYSREQQLPVPGDTTIAEYTTSTVSAHAGSSFILSRLDDRTTLAPDITLQSTKSEAKDPKIKNILPIQQYGLIPAITYQDDRTNDIFNPTSGHLFNGLVDVGVPIPGNISSSQFLRVVPLYKHYLDLSGKGTSVLAGRIRVGRTFLFSPDDPQAVPPPERRFYGGGSNSIRGWPDRTLLVSADTSADPVFGGYNVIEASVEYRWAPFQYEHEWTSWQKLSAPIRFVVFGDAGNVWDNTVDIFKDQKIALSAGIGIRYNMFFGPLRFDWGLKIYDPSGRFTHSNYKSINPSDRGEWIWSNKRTFSPDIMTFQIGIGQAF